MCQSLAIDAIRSQHEFAVGLQTELGDLAKYDGPHHRAHAQLMEPANYEGIESGLTFLGLCGLMDPPRPEVAAHLVSAVNLGGSRAVHVEQASLL